MKKLFIPFCFIAMTTFACGIGTLSVTDLPLKAQEYLSTKYPNIKIIEIDKEDGGFEVKLLNRIEIYFSLDGNYISSKLE